MHIGLYVLATRPYQESNIKRHWEKPVVPESHIAPPSPPSASACSEDPSHSINHDRLRIFGSSNPLAYWAMDVIEEATTEAQAQKCQEV